MRATYARAFVNLHLRVKFLLSNLGFSEDHVYDILRWITSHAHDTPQDQYRSLLSLYNYLHQQLNSCPQESQSI